MLSSSKLVSILDRVWKVDSHLVAVVGWLRYWCHGTTGIGGSLLTTGDTGLLNGSPSGMP